MVLLWGPSSLSRDLIDTRGSCLFTPYHVSDQAFWSLTLSDSISYRFGAVHTHTHAHTHTHTHTSFYSYQSLSCNFSVPGKGIHSVASLLIAKYPMLSTVYMQCPFKTIHREQTVQCPSKNLFLLNEYIYIYILQCGVPMCVIKYFWRSLICLRLSQTYRLPILQGFRNFPYCLCHCVEKTSYRVPTPSMCVSMICGEQLFSRYIVLFS